MNWLLLGAFCTAIGCGIAWSVGQVDIAVGIISIQWMAFVPSYLIQTDKFYDLTGASTTLLAVSASFATTTLTNHFGNAKNLVDAFKLAATTSPRRVLLSWLSIIWAIRFGSFLFTRIMRAGKDSRFVKILPNPANLWAVWTMQGLWVLLINLPVFITNNSVRTGGAPLSVVDGIAVIFWLAGFFIESVADEQKRQWRKNPATREKFINTGLWRFSRHPNYFGEILLWTAVTVSAAQTFKGFEWFGVLSPVFTFLLLRYVSGVPLLEKASDKRFGNDPEYQSYKKGTNMIMLGCPRSKQSKQA